MKFNLIDYWNELLPIRLMSSICLVICCMFIFLIKLNYDTFVQISDLEEAETNLREELTATERIA